MKVFDIKEIMAEENKNEYKSDTEYHEKFNEILNTHCTKTSKPIIVGIDSETRLDHYHDLGWYLHNKIFREVPSEYHIEANFNWDVVGFLETNGTLIYRKITENHLEKEFWEVVYSFLYKNTVIVLSYSLFEKENIKSIHMYHSINDNIVPISNELKQFQKEIKQTPKIGIIKQTKYGPTVAWKPHITVNEFSTDNYNEDFPDFLDNLTVKLNENNNGLYLLYGEAGTGKSSAIRHLITTINRPFVFIPPQMVNYLANPEFTDLVLTSLKNSVLIIEDAEKALMKRESEDAFHNSELVSTLLNLTDGLYADLAGTSIIATYNCDRNRIDPALLRKGRMKAEYKFNRLSIERAQNLFDKLKIDKTVQEPMTLADIFNHNKQYSNDERDSDKPKRAVGFGS
jgi:hypothetical protein